MVIPLLPFSAVAPGLMVFSVLLLSVYTATGLAREVETRSLGRYRLSGAGLGSLILGNVAAQLVLATVAFAAMLVAALAMGLEIKGTLVAAYCVVLLTSVGVIGIGLAIAAWVRRREDAAYLALLVCLPLGFLSGGFFPVPEWTFPGTGFNLYDLIPASHAVEALRQVIAGGGFSDVGEELATIGALGLAVLGMGAAMFWWRRYRVAT